jgi:hypothetical protein
MSKDAAPPPPAVHYEGYRWLGSQWGRSGKPTPSKVSGTLMLAAAAVVFYVAINAVRNDSPVGAVVASALVGTACVLAAVFYFVEAHFAGRARDEQQPTPASDPTEAPRPDPGVGP